MVGLKMQWAASLVGAMTVVAACGGDDTTGDSTTTSTGTGASGTGASGTGASGTGGNGTAGANVGGVSDDIPGGGTVLFVERFDDNSFDARGWYDGPSGTISTTEHAQGSTSAFECELQMGATSCAGGKPARHPLSTASETVYLSFWIKFEPDWVGSGKPYHPHMFHFLTDEDDDFVGPSHTFLTTYTEVVGGRALLALQDSKNVDLGCILKNDDTFEGCSGDFASYPFTESRSACSCNGLAGDLDGRDCFPNGDGTWYSSRSWGSDGAFTTTAGPGFQGDWHFVEVYFALNSISGDKGVPDGKIRWVQDGQTLVKSDSILMRTATHASMKFDQFAMLPYIGDGSPKHQRFWVDDLTVATARP